MENGSRSFSKGMLERLRCRARIDKLGISQEIRSLLHEYRLALPHGEAVFPDQKTGNFEDSVMLVAMPSGLAASEEGRNVLVVEAKRDGPDKDTILNIDFSLPADSDRRFLNLVKTFNLHVVNVTADTLAVKSSSSIEVSKGGWYEESGQRPKFSRERLSDDKVKPQWKPWAKCREYK